ncbi:hypothetical protein SEUCBS140593_006663 [Sporothrix eucalyptigena]|uniref:SGNH hydrolase-type esterase domain-containing protein n=1 Tax=Sporothrix eucalyptigena TaxID=1812306 RepID=A0ABP0C6R0_9PEZI
MAQRPLRILCFGDSLTSGFTSSGLKYHPYHKALSNKLREAFPGLQVEIDEDGLDGGMTQHFSWRLRKVYRDHGPPQEVPFDWVIILGGTNDLSINSPPETIFEHLERTWSFAKLRKSKVLALTVPEVALLPSTNSARPLVTLADRRNMLNSLILGYKAPGIHAFDFKSAFSYEAMTPAERLRYYDDIVHFTEAGYDRMGEVVAESLINILKAEESAAAGPQQTTLSVVRPRKRKMFRDDDKDFEEEKGTPDTLQRGYIVVRRKDLD